MKKKLLCTIIAGILAVSTLAGCGKTAENASKDTVEEVTTVEETSVDESTQAEATSEATETSAVTQDRSGNPITLPEKVDTIISMAPSTTRVLIDLGLADKIKAIDTNSYAYLDSLPSDVQQFDMMNPDNEALVALEPDIIFTSGMSNVGGEDAFQSARDANICVADIPSSASFSDICDDILFIGDCVGKSEEASQLVDDFNSRLDEIKKASETITDKKTILFEISLPSEEYPSIYTLGKGTYLDEMITSIGAENATGDQESWISISEEEAIALNPDVIVTNVNYIDNVVDTIKAAPGWENVNAIKNGEVYYIDADTSNQPNNHVLDAMIQMAKQVYPDAFSSFDDPFASNASSGDAE